MAKILITGASGRLGSSFVSRLDEVVSNEHEIYLLKRKNPIKFSQAKGFNYSIINSLPNSREYDFAFHFAGNLHTSMGDPQKNPENYPVFVRDNVELTKEVCDASSHVLFASTDNVFSGMDRRDYKEDDAPNPPNNFYGRTKALAEKVVLDKGGAAIRFQSPLGVSSSLIVDRIFDAIEGRPSWSFWNDQFIRPAFFGDMLLAFKRIYQGKKQGIYHISCSGETPSRAEIAKKVLGIYKTYDIPRQKESIEEEPCNNPNFPRRLVLDTSYTRKELGIEKFTDVDEAIKIHVLRIKALECL